MLRRALIDGVMVVLPIGAIMLLVLGIVRRLQQAADPVAGGYVHPVVAALLMFLLLCLVIGLLVQSAGGRWARKRLEELLFDRIPGYRLAKAFTGDGPLAEGGARAMQPALASIEEGLCPALVMDVFSDGRLLVFVPASPAPMSGALYIFTPDRVVYLDVPLLPFMKAISSWGLGLRQMIEAREPAAGRP